VTKKQKKQKQGPSTPSNVNQDQMQWHTAASDDEESYANEMESLYKD